MGEAAKEQHEEAPDVSDAQRLVVFRELVAYQYRHGQTHMDQAMAAYEREIKARMGVEA